VTTHTGEHNSHHRTKTARRSREFERRLTPTHIELVRDEEEGLPERRGLARLSDVAKRVIDIVGALVGLVLAAPVMILVGLAIKLDSKGPVLFAHRRLGRDGKHFDCLKFRTMHIDAERRVFENEELRHQYVSNHFKIPSHLDPRITRLGRFLRKSSLDEFPQLWNVLVGEMSLVGPRPIVALEATHYGDNIAELLSIRPGLTGLWAVEGRSDLGYPQRADVELQYVRTRSLGADLVILARTPWTVVTQRGTI
jgi:exopolysaccharide production protein ExoY